MRKFIVLTLICSIYADNINTQSAVGQMSQDGSAFGVQPGPPIPYQMSPMASAMSPGGLSASQMQVPMGQPPIGYGMGPNMGMGQDFVQQQYGQPMVGYGASPYMQSQIGRRYGAALIGPPILGPPVLGAPVMGPPVYGSYGAPYYNGMDPYYNPYFY